MDLSQIVGVLAWPVSAVVLAAIILWSVWRARAAILRMLGLHEVAARNPYLGALFGFALIVAPVWLILLYYAVVSFFLVTGEGVLHLSGMARVWHFLTVSAVVLTLAILAAGPLLLARAWIAERQTAAAEAARAAAEEGARAERFRAAVAQLGAMKTETHRRFKPVYQRLPGGRIRRDAQGVPMVETDARGRMIGDWAVWDEVTPNIEQRIGAMFALERIAQADEDDHIPVMETICAYIRENAAAEELPEAAGAVSRFRPPRPDIQMALRILGRRPEARLAFEASQTPPYRLDLTGADLPMADLARTRLGPVKLAGACLQGAWLDAAELDGADLAGADMAECWMEATRARHARLDDARLTGAWLVGADLARASLAGADLSGARLRGAVLAGASLERVRLDGTDISEADLTLAWLRGVDCRGFEGLTQAQLDSAFGDDTTILPDGIDRPDWPQGPLNDLQSWEMWQHYLAQAGLA